MNDPSAAPYGQERAAGDEQRRRRLRFELIFASAWLAFGLFVLPALIYAVGNVLLGPYGPDQGGADAGLGSFYGDFFGDLAELSGRTWAIVLGPLLLVTLVRALFFGMAASSPDQDDAAQAGGHERSPAAQVPDPSRRAARPVAPDKPHRPAAPSARTSRPARIEPRIGSDEP